MCLQAKMEARLRRWAVEVDTPFLLSLQHQGPPEAGISGWVCVAAEGWQTNEVKEEALTVAFCVCFKKATRQPAINPTAQPTASPGGGRRLLACPAAACHPAGTEEGSRALKGH